MKIWNVMLAAALYAGCILATPCVAAPAATAEKAPKAKAVKKTASADKQTSLPSSVVPAARNGKRHKENLQRAKEGPIGVLFMGDSITARWISAPEVWKKSFGKWDPANFGIGGDRTENVIWRINNGELDGISPKVMVLMIGTNNTHSNTPEEIIAGIKKIIELTQSKLPNTKILLLGVFPREARTRDGVLQTMPVEKVKAVNKLLPALADGKRVRYLDITNKFLVDGKVPKEIMPDGVHPSVKGYEIWAEAIMPVLEEMMQ